MPDLHRIRHSVEPAETDADVGAVFPHWDMLLGTYRGAPRQPHATMPLGLSERHAAEVSRLLWWLTSSCW